jgi:repressor LexA
MNIAAPSEKVEPLGPRIRKQRRRLGLTLDELAGRTRISKPYLSLIETGRVPNPPSDEKLRRLEQTLGFPTGELVTQAHLQRTPDDVRAVLGRLLSRETAAASVAGASAGFDVDSAYLTGALRNLVDGAAANIERVAAGVVPVINRISAGYPKDFSDLGYPSRVAEQFVGSPDLSDKEAFAARVHGDSMTPKYNPGDIVIFSPALTARDGDDCFVRFADGQTTFKRVFFETEGPAKKAVIRLQPRNEKYRPLVAAADSISGLYRAVFRYERVSEE